MSNNQEVTNVTTGESMKLKKARRRVAEGALIWVVENFTVRSVTFADLAALRETVLAPVQPSPCKPAALLCTPELHGIRFAPPAAERSISFLRRRRTLISQANWLRPYAPVTT